MADCLSDLRDLKETTCLGVHVKCFAHRVFDQNKMNGRLMSVAIALYKCVETIETISVFVRKIKQRRNKINT